MEIWKPVAGYEGLYEVSNLGRVKSFHGQYGVKERILKPRTHQGYFAVNLAKDGTVTCKWVARLVAIAFVPNPNNLPVVNHINGVKTDNRPENLEWVTVGDNTRHAFRTGLLKGGYGAKISADTASHIKARLVNGDRPSVIAREMSLPDTLVYAISCGQSWRKLEPSIHPKSPC